MGDPAQHHGYIFITLVGDVPGLEDLKLYESTYIKKLIDDHNAGKLKIIAFTDVNHNQFSSPDCAFHESTHPGISNIQLHELSQGGRMPGGMAILQFAPIAGETTDPEETRKLAGVKAAISYYNDADHQAAMEAGGVGSKIFRDVRLCQGPKELFKAGSGYWYMKVHKIHSQERRSKYLEAYAAVLQSGEGSGFRVEYSSNSTNNGTVVREKMRPVFGWPMASDKRECAALKPGNDNERLGCNILYNPSKGFGCAEEREGTPFFPAGKAPGVPGADLWTDSDGLVGISEMGTFDRAMAFRSSLDYRKCIFAAVGEEYSEEKATDAVFYEEVLDRHTNEVCARDIRIFCCVGLPEKIQM